MADNESNGRPAGRLILAPHPGPWPPLAAAPGGPKFFYLSWAGWEIYLERRLNLRPSAAYRPLLLPDLENPGRDFAAIDQLARQAGQLGAGFLSLGRQAPESLSALKRAISSYSGPAVASPRPLLDDRSSLALWAAAEWQRRAGEELLSQAAAGLGAMWAALKGEAPAGPPAAATAPQEERPDRRGAYAWQCWRRLAAPLLAPGDVILPTYPPEEA